MLPSHDIQETPQHPSLSLQRITLVHHMILSEYFSFSDKSQLASARCQIVGRLRSMVHLDLTIYIQRVRENNKQTFQIGAQCSTKVMVCTVVVAF